MLQSVQFYPLLINKQLLLLFVETIHICHICVARMKNYLRNCLRFKNFVLFFVYRRNVEKKPFDSENNSVVNRRQMDNHYQRILTSE